MKVGILALQGDVTEHIEVLKRAAAGLKNKIEIAEARTKNDLRGLHGLIIPGGESTVLQKLCERENMFAEMKKIKNIFGTCAGTIMLAQHVLHKENDQHTLKLMDITVDRNAYGRQTESFEANIETAFGKMKGVFIRAPKITKTGGRIKVLARFKKEIIACEERIGNRFYLALAFHPELENLAFHRYFLQNLGW